MRKDSVAGLDWQSRNCRLAGQGAETLYFVVSLFHPQRTLSLPPEPRPFSMKPEQKRGLRLVVAEMVAVVEPREPGV